MLTRLSEFKRPSYSRLTGSGPECKAVRQGAARSEHSRSGVKETDANTPLLVICRGEGALTSISHENRSTAAR